MKQSMYDQIPAQVKEKMIGVYGAKARGFLQSLPRKLEMCIDQWALDDCRFFAHSLNLIYTAKTKQYGEVVLKVGAISTASYHLGNAITGEKYAFHQKRCEVAYALYRQD